jgi:hypothetical protein
MFGFTPSNDGSARCRYIYKKRNLQKKDEQRGSHKIYIEKNRFCPWKSKTKFIDVCNKIIKDSLPVFHNFETNIVHSHLCKSLLSLQVEMINWYCKFRLWLSRTKTSLFM